MVGLTDDDGELMAVLRRLCTSPPSYIMRGEESNVLVDIHEPVICSGKRCCGASLCAIRYIIYIFITSASASLALAELQNTCRLLQLSSVADLRFA